MKPVFIDTAAFIALANAADQYHQEAVACLATLRATRAPLVTTNFILDEVYTRLQRRGGLKIAITFGEKIQASRQIRIHTVEKSLEKLAWEIFRHDTGHAFSYTDCTSFAFMRRRKICKSFTFDRDFVNFGWTVVPGKVWN